LIFGDNDNVIIVATVTYWTRC